jgi:nucleotide-binding universal stress UspA family protein
MRTVPVSRSVARVNEVIVGIEPGRLAEGEDALALGMLLARSLEAHVLAVSVIDPMASSDEAERDLGLAIAAVQARLGALVQVDALAVGGGSPARRLHELAGDRSCVAVALGSSRHAARRSLVAGTVGGRVLEGSRVPVAVAPRGYGRHDGPDVRTIGVGYLDSAEGREALAYAGELARGAHARLRVITVFDHLALPESALGGDRDALRARSRRALDEALGAIGEDLESEGVWLEGEPIDELTDATADLDLLVVGSRGYGPVRAVLLGGVSAALMRQAGCPVVIVPRAASARRRVVPAEKP